jgi:exonuclease SbcC
MAAALEEGEPCPVCGATHHPQKAPLSDETPTQAQVEAAEADAAAARTGAETPFRRQRCSRQSG